MNKPIKLSSPKISNRSIYETIKVLKSGTLAQGEKTKKFETEFSKKINNLSCVAVNSGTSALHVAISSLGLKPGFEVLVPSFSFAATANSVMIAGGKPVFVDINPLTFNINVEKIEDAINSSTKVILPVHLYGLPADMLSINVIAKKHNLYVIEDAAQAHGASINSTPVGCFGDLACFSFYPTKNMTSCEGGMIAAKQTQHEDYCRLLINQGMAKKYENEIVGFNLRMTEVHATIGLGQLKKLDFMNMKRLEIANYYNSNIEKLQLPFVPKGFKHVYHQFTFRLPAEVRSNFQAWMKTRGIETGVYYPTPIHRLRSFNFADLDLPETNLAAQEVVSIPIHPNLHLAEYRRVAECINIYTEKEM